MPQVIFQFSAGANNYTVSSGFSTFALTKTGAFPAAPYQVTGAVITFSKINIDSVFRGLQVYSNSPAVNASLLSTVALRHLGFGTGTYNDVAFDCDLGVNYAGIEVINLRSLQADASSAGALMSIRAGSTVTLTVTYKILQSSLTLDKATLDAGQTIRANISTGDGAYTHRITWAFGGRTQVDTVAAGVAFKDFTVPLVWLDQIPTALSGTLNVTLETLSGGSAIGSEVKTAAVTVGAGVVPTIGSVTAERINNGVPAGWAVYLAGVSQAKVSIIGAVAGTESTLTAISINGAGLSIGAWQGTSAVLPSGTHTYTGVVTDGRGRTASGTVSITVLEYTKPVITSANSSRCDSAGVQAGAGTYIKAVLGYAIAPAGGNNNAVVAIKYRQRGAEPWTTAHSGALASGGSVVIGGGGIAAGNSYEVQYAVTDALGSAAVYVDAVGTAEVFMHKRAGGKGLGIGGYCEADNRVQIAADWDVFGGELKPSVALGIAFGGTGAGSAAIGAFNLLYKHQPPSNNLNNAYANGLYWVQATDAGQPTSGGVHGILVVHNLIADGTGSFAEQILSTPTAPQKFWRRICSTNGIWSRWYAFAGTID